MENIINRYFYSVYIKVGIFTLQWKLAHFEFAHFPSRITKLEINNYFFHLQVKFRQERELTVKLFAPPFVSVCNLKQIKFCL